LLKANSSIIIRGATAGEIKSFGKTILTLQVSGNTEIAHDFQVVDKHFNIETDGILGRDFLKKYRCSIDYDTYTLNTHYENLKIETTLMDNWIMLPARSEVIRKISAQNLKNVLIESQEIQTGIFCANSIGGDICYVRFINATDKNTILKKFEPKV